MSGKFGNRRTMLFIVLLLFTVVFCFPVKSNAYEVQFSAKPKRCIKPRGEKLCASTIELQWRSNKRDSYCIYVQGESKVLQCWENKKKGEANVEFRSAESVTYLLRLRDEQIVISTVQVSVVYSLKRANKKKSSRRRLWRAF